MYKPAGWIPVVENVARVGDEGQKVSRSTSVILRENVEL